MQRQAHDLILYPSLWKMAFVALGSLLFVVGASLLWTSGILFFRAVAAVGILFSGYGFFFALGRLLWAWALSPGRRSQASAWAARA